MDFFVKKSLTNLLSVIIIILNKFLGGKYMFSNIGNKIRVLAKVICIIGMVLAGIVGLIIMISGFAMLGNRYTTGAGVGLIIGGLVYAAIGALFSWIGSFVLYGYGQLILSTQNLEKQFCETSTDSTFTPMQPDANVFGNVAPVHQAPATVECPNCHYINSTDSKFCVKCGCTLK